MLALDLATNGLIIGVFYALMAIGLSLIFGILKVVNFAHGEFYMVGAYAYTLGALLLGIPPWLALPLAFLAGGLLGVVVERAADASTLCRLCQLERDARRICGHRHLRALAAAHQSGRQDHRPVRL